jgi:hydrogenase-1 operon protein HyaE
LPKQLIIFESIMIATKTEMSLTIEHAPAEGWTDAHQLPLLRRLVTAAQATWLPRADVADWVAGAGDRVLLLAGDAVRFPEGQDVAAVLPELKKAFPARFAVGIVPREDEDEVARR